MGKENELNHYFLTIDNNILNIMTLLDGYYQYKNLLIHDKKKNPSQLLIFVRKITKEIKLKNINSIINDTSINYSHIKVFSSKLMIPVFYEKFMTISNNLNKLNDNNIEQK